MSGKFALIIGNTEYTDPGLAQLSAPGKDVEDFSRVLQSKDICDFDDVKISLNEPSSSVIEAIDEFFDQKKPDDLLVLYFSGHGVKDEIGSLYLAFKNTVRSRLRSTAIKSDYIREAMDQSRSKRQVLILDCCNSGAFPQGTKAEIGGAMGMAKAFQGYGRFVLTASDATQFAWEGDKIIGETDNSLFTHFLVKGLEGEADSDGDGKITVDEIYDYTYQQISKVTPKQTPTKSSSKQEGEITLRENMRIEDIKPIALSDDLISEIEDIRPYVREAAVQKLEKILNGKNIGLARSAKEALEKIATDDNTTRRVAELAIQALSPIRQIESRVDWKTPKFPTHTTPVDPKGKQNVIWHPEYTWKETTTYLSAHAIQLVERAITYIKGLNLKADLQSLIHPDIVRGTKPSKFRGFLIFIFWLWLFLTISPFIISFILGIPNVALIFLCSIIAFGVIGVRRGWAKEALVFSSIIPGIACNYFLSNYIPLVRDLDPTSVSRFWIETTIIELLIYFSYQISIRIPRILSKTAQERFRDKRFGVILGAVNGYMIAGTLLYYNHLAKYPFWNAPVVTNSALWQNINRMMLFMPPHVLGEPTTIYGALILSFIFTLIVLF